MVTFQSGLGVIHILVDGEVLCGAWAGDDVRYQDEPCRACDKRYMDITEDVPSMRV